MKKILFVMLVALVALPTVAQNFQEKDQLGVQFQSTSTLQGSGSQYSANPSISADGTAYSPLESAAPSQATSGPRKINSVGDPTKDAQDPMPLCDAVLPLMLMALAFAGVIALRRRRAINR